VRDFFDTDVLYAVAGKLRSHASATSYTMSDTPANTTTSDTTFAPVEDSHPQPVTARDAGDREAREAREAREEDPVDDERIEDESTQLVPPTPPSPSATLPVVCATPTDDGSHATPCTPSERAGSSVRRRLFSEVEGERGDTSCGCASSCEATSIPCGSNTGMLSFV
ncbi:Hypothetical protein UVM_LOCUS201, partial [uncultured virus]